TLYFRRAEKRKAHVQSLGTRSLGRRDGLAHPTFPTAPGKSGAPAIPLNGRSEQPKRRGDILRRDWRWPNG
ncbi:hypothetical protein, partial [Roseibium sp.]|uniref:hypothetical protein n=1 Tax=Roseibium sp. TaxID=1936156 RepID=UPI00329A0091